MKICIALLLMVSPAIWAQDCPQFLSAAPFEHPYCMTIEGSRGYLGDSNILRILDLSDPVAPAVISSITLTDLVMDVFIQGNYAYCAVYGAGLEIVDISDPADPQKLGHLATGGDAFGVAVFGNTAYLCATTGGLIVADVSDSSRPKEIKRFSDMHSYEAAISGNILYVAAEELVILSIENPAAPQILSRTRFLGGRDIRVQGNYIFTPGWLYALQIVDATDKTIPALLARWGDPYMGIYYDNIEVRGDIAYAAGNAAILAIDIHDASGPFLVGQDYSAGSAYGDMGAYGDYLYARTGSDGLFIYDISRCTHEDAAPKAAFSWAPNQPIVGEKVVFNDASLPFPTVWHWDFGDGTTFDTEERRAEWPVHAYVSAGTFNVTLTVSNPAGSDILTLPIQVLAGPAAPDISNAGIYRYIIPAAAHSPGANGTNWVSDLEILNYSNEETRANIYFLPGGTDNSDAQGVAVSVPSFQALRIEDIVRRMFGREDAAGALLVGSNSPLRLTSRTYNTGGGEGTYGQFVPAVAEADSFKEGESGSIQQLTWNEAYRTNLGFANMGPDRVNVGVTLYSSEGLSVSWGYFLEPYGWTQSSLKELLDMMTIPPQDRLEDGYLVISSGSPESDETSIAAYASVVDNRTGDAILIPAMKAE